MICEAGFVCEEAVHIVVEMFAQLLLGYIINGQSKFWHTPLARLKVT